MMINNHGRQATVMDRLLLSNFIKHSSIAKLSIDSCDTYHVTVHHILQDTPSKLVFSLEIRLRKSPWSSPLDDKFIFKNVEINL